MKTCVYPGSFDPFTNGHLDIALRAGDLFDKVVILISQNPGKGERFLPAEEMQKAIYSALATEAVRFFLGQAAHQSHGLMLADADIDGGDVPNIVDRFAECVVKA